MQSDPERVYAIILRYPESNQVDLYAVKDFVTEKTKVTMLGYKGEIQVRFPFH